MLLLGAGSRFGMPAELLFERRPDGVLFATFIQHENRIMRSVWAPIGPGHRRVVQYLLEHAVRSGEAMELGGLEPPTSWVRSRRSPN